MIASPRLGIPLVWRLALAFVDIAFHRRGPEDLPASQFLVLLILAAYLLVGLVSLQVGPSFDQAAPLLFFDSALYVAFVWILLSLAGHARRFKQTVAALLGTETFLNLLSMPLLAWVAEAPDPAALPVVPRVLFLLLFLWSIDVAGYILSRALDRAYVLGVLIVIVYVTGSIALRTLFFPVDT